MDNQITEAFHGAQAGMMELSQLMQSVPNESMQERGRKLERALNTAQASFVFNQVPALLDAMARAERQRKRREARLRVLWINKLTLGLTYNQRRELWELSAL